MKILAVADLHGKVSRLEAVVDAAKEYQVEVVVIAGDIVGRRRAGEVISRLADLALPVLTVSGNSDSSAMERAILRHESVVDLHLKQTIVAGIPFIGLSGTIPLPFYSKIRFRENRLLQQIGQKMQSDSILVTHTPPRGSVDKVLGKFHAGSNGLAALVDRVQPRLLICGHIHEDAGVFYQGETCVVNCSVGGKGKGYLIELEPGGAGVRLQAL